MEDEAPKNITLNKLIITIIIFVGIGLFLNTFLSYNQNAATQTTLGNRAEVGNEILELTKEQGKQIVTLVEKVGNLETKLENLEKTGKTIK